MPHLAWGPARPSLDTTYSELEQLFWLRPGRLVVDERGQVDLATELLGVLNSPTKTPCTLSRYSRRVCCILST